MAGSGPATALGSGRSRSCTARNPGPLHPQRLCKPDPCSGGAPDRARGPASRLAGLGRDPPPLRPAASSRPPTADAECGQASARESTQSGNQCSRPAPAGSALLFWLSLTGANVLTAAPATRQKGREQGGSASKRSNHQSMHAAPGAAIAGAAAAAQRLLHCPPPGTGIVLVPKPREPRKEYAMRSRQCGKRVGAN